MGMVARGLTRREALRGGAALVAVARSGLVAGCSTSVSDSMTGATSSGSGTGGTGPTVAAGAELPDVRTVKSVDGVLRTTLTAKRASVDIGAPKAVGVMAYGEILPGETWELSPGDTMMVHLVNALPPLPGDARHSDNLNRPHDWTHTNLHTHGLHVSPSGISDNIFLDVAPGETQDYVIEVPPDHTGGLFWYHPHDHGGVAQQVRAGLAGAIIIRGDLDQVPEVKAAREKVMVIQALELDKEYQVPDPIPDPSDAEAFTPRSQILYPINGVLKPKITMYPGEVQRWRILNAAEGKLMSIRLVDHQLQSLAWDGLTLDAPEALDEALLSGGNRLDVLVKAGAPGTYDLVLTPGSSQHPEIPGSPNPTAPPATAVPELVARSIATLEVTGTGPAMALPSTLPAFSLPPVPPVTRTREVTYSVDRVNGKDFVNFGVDGHAFDPEAPPYQVKLGTTEEWTIVNGVDAKLPQHAHVFHIHVNPFKVTKVNGRVLDKPLWRDTYVLNGSNGDSFTFETTFLDFTGKFVEHCHVLTHEDLGMMETIEVVP